MENLQCMSFTSKGASEIIVAGFQDTMFVIDVVKGEIVKQVGLVVLARKPPLPSRPELTSDQRSLQNITTPS